jgi:DNA invertase Pin-like site-specific DNA recombinase
VARARTSKPGNPTTAIAYLRVSTDHQDLGPEAQRQAIEAWAAVNGIEIISSHLDKGVSGGSEMEDRPELIAAIGDIKVHGAGVLLVAKRDRLARDTLVAQLIEQAVGKVGAVVISADGVANGDDPASRMVRSILDAVSEYERQVIKSRIKAALSVKKARRELVGSVPFGFMLDEDGSHLVSVKSEQKVINKARRLRGLGMSYRAVAEKLGKLGFKSRTGKVFDPTQVRRMVMAG